MLGKVCKVVPFCDLYGEPPLLVKVLEEWGDRGRRWRFISDRLLNLIPPVSLVWHQLDGGSFGL